MKKILTILIAAFIGGSALAQDAPAKARVESSAKFNAGKSKGTYEFLIPSATADEVKKTSAYYTQYFTVDFDDKTKTAKIKMVKTDEQAKHVIVRFLVANQVKEVSMDGKDYSPEEFFKQHIL